jgi:hypothetical protein
MGVLSNWAASNSILSTSTCLRGRAEKIELPWQPEQFNFSISAALGRLPEKKLNGLCPSW